MKQVLWKTSRRIIAKVAKDRSKWRFLVATSLGVTGLVEYSKWKHFSQPFRQILQHWFFLNFSFYFQTPPETVPEVENKTQICDDNRKWLLKGPRQGVKEFQLEEICRANEPCQNLDGCLSQPNCALFCQQKLSTKNPIDPLTVFKPQKLSTEQWLSVPRRKEEDVPDRSHSCRDNKELRNKWLQQDQDTALEFEPLPKIGRFCHDSNLSPMSAWLLTPQFQQEVEGKSSKEKEFEEMEKESSESWSLCSSPSTLSDDQFEKDVEVATDYLKKWILS